MKNAIKFLLSFVFALFVVSCDDAYEVNYEPPIKISFDGVEDGIATLEKGVYNYTAKIKVTSVNGLNYFEIYNADAKTGEKGTLIEGTNNLIDPVVSEYTYEYSVTNLTGNSCIRISASDAEGNTAERNLVVKITPSVLLSGSITMETADDYYGSYYATWLDGRVYLRSNGADYASEIDLTMGMVDVGGTMTPMIISPAKRGDYNLPTLAGLKDTKFEELSMTVSEYNAISQIDSSPITSLADPTLSAVELKQNKVYLFKTADGKKGLLAVTGLTNRTGTIQDAAGEWIKDYVYRRVVMTTKTAN